MFLDGASTSQTSAYHSGGIVSSTWQVRFRMKVLIFSLILGEDSSMFTLTTLLPMIMEVE